MPIYISTSPWDIVMNELNKDNQEIYTVMHDAAITGNTNNIIIYASEGADVNL